MTWHCMHLSSDQEDRLGFVVGFMRSDRDAVDVRVKRLGYTPRWPDFAGGFLVKNSSSLMRTESSFD